VAGGEWPLRNSGTAWGILYGGDIVRLGDPPIRELSGRDASRMCELLVGLPAVKMLGVDEDADGVVVIPRAQG
jgi:hypothetical protein